MSDVVDDLRRRTQGRSPPFPFIPLGRAVERARELEAYSRGHAVRAASAATAWGYKPTSSGGLQTTAALKGFGLLSEMPGPEKRVQLTEMARKLLRNPPEPVRLELLRKAALAPKVINEYWGLWGGDRPPDDDCRWALQEERGFTPDAANRFLSVYDATLSYAGLTDSAKVSDMETDEYGDIDAEVGPVEAKPSILVEPIRSSGGQEGVALMPGERVVFTERVRS